MRESQLQYQIIKYLQTRKDVFFYRQNSGSFAQQAKDILISILRKMPIQDNYKNIIIGLFFKNISKYKCTSVSGIPDLIVIQKGCFIGIELKTEQGRQSLSQKQTQKNIEKAGGKYFIVKNIDELKKILSS